MFIIPHDNYILPKGRSELIINDYSLISVLKDHFLKDDPISIAHIEDGDTKSFEKISAIVTSIEIIDFNTNNDSNCFTITIEGVNKLLVHQISYTNSCFLKARTQSLKNWLDIPLEKNLTHVAHKLCDFYANNTSIGKFYPKKELDNASWVAQRWLEILPINSDHKRLLISQDNPNLTLLFLHKLLEKN